MELDKGYLLYMMLKPLKSDTPGTFCLVILGPVQKCQRLTKQNVPGGLILVVLAQCITGILKVN